MDWREEMAENNSNKKTENELKKKGGQFAAEEEKLLKPVETDHKLAQNKKTENELKKKGSQFAAEEENALKAVETYHKLAQDVMQRGPDALPKATFLDAVINQFEGVKSELLDDVSVHQGEVNQANAALTACNTNMQLSFNETDGVEDLEAKVGIERKDHSNCRVLENSKKETKTTKCDHFKRIVDSATCAELKSGPWLTSNGGGLVDAAKACTTATLNLTNTSEQCDKEQETFEKAFCEYAGALNTACGTHEGCWTRESGRRNTTYSDVRKLQVSHKAIWAAFSKANCFLNLLKKAAHTNLTESDMKNCTQLSPNTTALDIAYPNASVRSNCSVTPGSPQPGNTSWRASEYGASPFTEHPQHLEDTQPCPLPAPQPVPAPTPPVVQGKCVRGGSVSHSSHALLNSGSDPVATCRSHCKGHDYFGMECPGQHHDGLSTYCKCLSSSEYDKAPQLPMFHCLGECKMPPNGQTSTCTGRSLHGPVDDNCPGILINGQRHFQWNGYALGASWRTAIYSVS